MVDGLLMAGELPMVGKLSVSDKLLTPGKLFISGKLPMPVEYRCRSSYPFRVYP